VIAGERRLEALDLHVMGNLSRSGVGWRNGGTDDALWT
jgi:hypothetical protein